MTAIGTVAAGERASIRRRLLRMLTPPSLDEAQWQALARSAFAVRLVAALTTLLVLSASDEVADRRRIAVAIVLGFVWLPYQVVAYRLSSGSHRTGAWLMSAVGDLLGALLFGIISEAAEIVALFAYLVMLAFHTTIGGTTVGLTLAGLALGLVVICEAFLDAQSGLDAFTLGGFAAAAGTIVLLVGVVNAEAFRTRLAGDLAKSEFLTLVSHELRTPLTSIRGTITTITNHWDALSEEDRRDLLLRASQNTDSLALMIEQLLDYARLEEDKFKPTPVPFGVAKMVGDLLRAIEPVTWQHEVVVEIEGGLNAFTDARAYEHVMSNLLTNAVKFSPAGSAIRVSAKEQGGEIVTSVRDEGAGIDPALHGRIFDRFYQVDPQASKGAGIGLSIVARYVALLGGRIWLESGPGKGTSFYFTVPAASSARST